MQDIPGDNTEIRNRVANDWAKIAKENAPNYFKIEQAKEAAIAEFKTITFTFGPPAEAKLHYDYTDRPEDVLIAQSKVIAEKKHLENEEPRFTHSWGLSLDSDTEIDISNQKLYWSIYDNLFGTRIIDFDRIAYSGKEYDVIRHPPKADPVVSVIFAQLDRNVVCEILKACSIQTIGRLAQVNKWFYKLCMLDTVWTNVFEKFKALLDIHDKMPESLKVFDVRVRRDPYRKLIPALISETTMKKDAEEETNGYLKTKKLLSTLIKKHQIKPFYHDFGENCALSVDVDNYMLSPTVVYRNGVSANQIKLGQAIERGSFGVVRRARWLRSIVAVKILPTIKASETMAFLKEMSYACGLRHPNIVATMGAVTKPYCALIMELMPWGSLKASLNDPRRRQHYDLKKMVRGMMSVCRAGAYLASVCVIHRDISSKNVFVNAGFESMKLGDFGYSSLLEHQVLDRQDPEYGKRLTDQMYIFAGAPAYKAPELLSSKPIYSEASDVFAFAIVSWEMITTLWAGTYGRPWSDINSEDDLSKAIVTGVRPPLDPNFYRVSEKLLLQTEKIAQIIQQCWDQNAKRRPSFLTAHDQIESTEELKEVKI